MNTNWARKMESEIRNAHPHLDIVVEIIDGRELGVSIMFGSDLATLWRKACRIGSDEDWHQKVNEIIAEHATR